MFQHGTDDDLTVETALRETVASLLDVDAGEIGPSDDLVEWGVDSLAMMTVARFLRGRGVDVEFAELAESATLTAWVALAARRERCAEQAAPDGPGGAVVVDESAPFELAPMQHAFWLGRMESQRLGGVGAHFHHEFTGAGIDPDRLERAVRALFARHGMLRARIHDDGTQTVAPRTSWPGLTVHDLRTGPDPEGRAEAVRDWMSNRSMDIADGQVFDVALSLLPGGEHRLHVSLEMVVADALSFRNLLGDLARLYDRPDEPLPPIGYSFARYRAGREDAARTRRDADLTWWRERVPVLPDPPDLPLGAWALGRAPRRATRRHLVLDRTARDRFETAARTRGLTPAMAATAAFAEVVGHWATEPRFLLNLPVFGREPLHPDVGLLVGDFTDSVLLEVDLTEQAAFAQRARTVAARFRADAGHLGCSGMDVLRELGRDRGQQVLAPVVFTSALSIGDLVDSTFRRCLGEPSWLISQGPQVWLDAQVTELDGGLLINWDAAETSFADGVLDAMFTAFGAVLDRLGADDAAWDAPLVVPGPEPVAPAPGPADAPLVDDVLARLADRAADVVLRAGERSVTGAGLLGRITAVRHGPISGIDAGEPVGIAVTDPVDRIAAALAVLAEGGTVLGVPQAPGPLARTVLTDEVLATAVQAFGSGAPGAAREVAGSGAAVISSGTDARGRPTRPVASRAELAAARAELTYRTGLRPQDRVELHTADPLDPALLGALVALGDAGVLVLPEVPGAPGDPGVVPDVVIGGRAALDRLGPAAGTRTVVVLEPGGPVPGPGGAGAQAPTVLGWEALTPAGVPTVVRTGDEQAGTAVPGSGLRVVDRHGRDRPDHVVGAIVHGQDGQPTGHRGRRLPAGRIVVVGTDPPAITTDGHRHELAGVEAVARRTPGVADAVATTDELVLVLPAGETTAAAPPDPPQDAPGPLSALVDAAIVDTLLAATDLGPEPRPTGELARGTGAPATAAPVLRRWLAHLADRGAVTSGPDGHRLTEHGIRLAGSTRWAELRAQALPHTGPALLDALDRHLDRMSGYLRGSRDPGEAVTDPLLGPAARDRSGADPLGLLVEVFGDDQDAPGGPVAAAVRAALPAVLQPPRIRVLADPPRRADGSLARGAICADRSAPADDDAPRGTAETLLAGLWAELLGVGPVARTDDFFARGGDSLIATRLIGRLRAAGVDGARIADVFAHPVLADHARLLTPPTGGAPAPAPSPADPSREGPAEFAPTEVQRAYWLGRRPEFTLGGVGCHFYREYEITDLDLDRLATALQRLVARHDMLRTVFDQVTGMQRVLDVAVLPAPVVPVVETAPGAAAERECGRMRDEMSHRVFDTASWPLFAVRAVRWGRTTRLAVGLDAIVLDALSVMVFYRELELLYSDPDAEPPRPGVSFRDLLAAGAPDPRRTADARAYWWSRIDGLPPAPRLPLARDPATIGPPRFVRHTAHLTEDRWRAVTERATGHGLTPSAVLFTAFGEVLNRWSGTDGLTLTVTLFDRPACHPDADGVLGDFTSLLLLAHHSTPGTSWADTVRGLQERLWSDLDHRELSALTVLRESARRDGVAERSAPVVVTSALGIGDRLGGASPGMFDHPVWAVSQTPQVWLDHQIVDRDGGVDLSWDVVEGLFPDGMVEEMFAAYLDLLDRVATRSWSGPLTPNLPAATVAARHGHNDTTAPQRSALLHEQVLAHARLAPERTAVLTGVPGEPDASTLTYGGLADIAARVAGGLRSAGVRRGDRVGITLAKGPAQVVAVLGVLVAGATYVPIGPDQPPARRERIHRLAGLRAVIAAGPADPAADVPVLAVDRLGEAEPIDAPVRVDPDDLAYIVFTSGSTGDPKGVQVTHRSARNTCEDLVDRFAIGPDDRVLAVSALDFDLSVFDLFGLLAAGGAVVTVEEGARRDAWRWQQLVDAHRITVWNSVPALLDMLLTVDPGAPGTTTPRLVLLSGDWVGLDQPERVADRWPGCRFVALGGATEAAIWSNAYEVAAVDPAWRSIPYGYPLRNQRFRVVDALGRDCPDHVPGELWIGGTGVAAGYCGAPEETARRFVTHDGERWYRTGDLGCYRPGGILEFLGRTDHQVQLRGYRVELGEIESALTRHPGVDQAVVVVDDGGPSGPRLAAAVTPALPGPRGAGCDPGDVGPVLDHGRRAAEAADVEHLVAGLLGLGADRQAAVAPDLEPVASLWRSWLTARGVLDDDGLPGRRLCEVLVHRPAGVAGDSPAAPALAGALERRELLAAILAGERDPLVLLDDPDLAPAAVLDTAPGMPDAVRRVVDVVAGFAAARPGAAVTVAEIGGHGSTAEAVPAACAARGLAVDHTVLAASPAAAERVDRSVTRVRTTDLTVVDDDLAGTFDLVLCTGTLHTFADPADGPATAALLLRPGGRLVAVEPAGLAPVGLLTAALLERGFTRLDPVRREHGSPMLTGAGWRTVLERAGWGSVTAQPLPGAELTLLIGDRPVAEPPAPDRLRAFAAEQLPAHMVPELVCLLGRAPLTANGKLDRGAIGSRLRRTGGPEGGGPETGPPRGDWERAVAAQWESLLGVAPGRGDNFFALGGDSLLATRFVAAMERERGVAIPMRHLFDDPVLHRVAAVAEVLAGPGPVPGEAEEYDGFEEFVL
ncbi:amino acid adenylation domain-containing protein [Pseudonocardia sp. NPDC046786]|uniref:amino acid adenylation domain-containing protein n=1 Tax=Pseudonocardia sp. NPDC046786 TaxID=3155471 RepID=UPI0033C806D1